MDLPDKTDWFFGMCPSIATLNKVMVKRSRQSHAAVYSCSLSVAQHAEKVEHIFYQFCNSLTTATATDHLIGLAARGFFVEGLLKRQKT